MSIPLLSTTDLTVRFGGHIAVDNVTTQFHPGELTAIVGPNGAGKTTFFNLISGQIRASSGQVVLNGQDISRLPVSARTKAGLGRAFQLTNLFPDLTVLENIRLVVQAKANKGFNLWSTAVALTDITAKAQTILAQVRLEHVAKQPVSELPHGDQRKLEVAILIALEPKVFMFDEPTAGMSLDEADTILDLIADLKARTECTVLLVEHKMDVIRTLADRIVVLHNGQLVADGPPAEVMASAIVQEAYLGLSPEDQMHG
ncbi:ABC transporter ATP-binding protein [Phaeobacter sp.]|uniref:ABC transporter ATP-binding protein n=1 Tax=Phaeobacter sp. TaxID=1902409 RepID=UPI0025EE14EE|nr:ABC transporter ATP-binding protein [Phaeobacter sp.]